MPITIADDLPAISILKSEGVMIKRHTDAVRQDIRPLEIALLNLMPLKETTEIQFARLLGASPLQVQLTLLTTDSYKAKNTDPSHIQKFYSHFAEIKHRKFDGLIITGAPVETMEFEEVAYWQELSQIFAWAKKSVYSGFAVCWGAQAAAYYFHQIPKYNLNAKKFGVYDQKILVDSHPLLAGFDDIYATPVSRHTENILGDFHNKSDRLLVLSTGDESGIGLVEDKENNFFYSFNHLEYDTMTLAHEYMRDKANGQTMPWYYYPNNQDELKPCNRWRAHAHLLFSNWLNIVYQGTPFDLDKIGAL